jgi:hypothetical protein
MKGLWVGCGEFAAFPAALPDESGNAVNHDRLILGRFGMTPAALRAYNRRPARAREMWPEDRDAEDVAVRYFTLCSGSSEGGDHGRDAVRSPPDF